ncbi:MAG: ferrous iron transport protein A [Nitrospiraceae bacterium]|nr:ferrous iron transport protein A [Nitrospiraceae bacterium]
MKLSNLKVGDSAKVVKVSTGDDRSLGRHLRDMGLVKDTDIKVTKLAPLGDPIEIAVRGYKLSLRKNEADCIDVVKI